MQALTNTWSFSQLPPRPSRPLRETSQPHHIRCFQQQIFCFPPRYLSFFLFLVTPLPGTALFRSFFFFFHPCMPRPVSRDFNLGSFSVNNLTFCRDMPLNQFTKVVYKQKSNFSHPSASGPNSSIMHSGLLQQLFIYFPRWALQNQEYWIVRPLFIFISYALSSSVIIYLPFLEFQNAFFEGLYQ